MFGETDNLRASRKERNKKESIITEIIIMLITYEIDYVKNNSNNPILCILKSWKLDWYTRALMKH